MLWSRRQRDPVAEGRRQRLGHVTPISPHRRRVRARQHRPAHQLSPASPYLGESFWEERRAAHGGREEPRPSRHQPGRAALRPPGSKLHRGRDPQGRAHVWHRARERRGVDRRGTDEGGDVMIDRPTEAEIEAAMDRDDYAWLVKHEFIKAIAASIRAEHTPDMMTSYTIHLH